MPTTSVAAGQLSGNLSFSTANKMIQKLLTCDRIKAREGKVNAHGIIQEELIVRAFTKKELTKKLSITQEELDKFKSPLFYKNRANKISLPLSRLYCATKFVASEHKRE